MYKEYTKTSVSGLESGLSVAVAVLIGYFIDHQLGTMPKATLVGLVIGALAGAKVLYEMSKKHMTQMAKEEAEENDR